MLQSSIREELLKQVDVMDIVENILNTVHLESPKIIKDASTTLGQ